MNIPRTGTKEYLYYLNRSVIVYAFLDKYNNLESIIRALFEKNLKNFTPKLINELYFLYGGRINTYFEYQTDCIKLNNIKYNEEESFKDFSINQIIKFCREKNCISVLKSNIPSVERQIHFVVDDCIIKLLSMRNCLAHELADITFKNNSLIDPLSDKKLDEYISTNFLDVNVAEIDVMSKHILSNIIYMDNIVSILAPHI